MQLSHLQLLGLLAVVPAGAVAGSAVLAARVAAVRRARYTITGRRRGDVDADVNVVNVGALGSGFASRTARRCGAGS